MPETNTDEKARKAIAESLLEIETALNADPEFVQMAELALEKVMDIAERFEVPPVLIVQCLFNRSAKATKDL